MRLAKALKELNYNVPEEISLIGFGGSSQRFHRGRRISTVKLDHKGLGRHTAELFQETLKGAAPRRIVLPIALLLHDSVANGHPVSESLPKTALQ